MSLPKFTELYQQLLLAPSISSTDSTLDISNKAVIDLLAAWFAELGFHIHISEVPDCPGKYNLVATYGSGDGGSYAVQSVNSTGVLGLTATLSAGTLAAGSGDVTYVISGTPSSSGTASFAITLGGQSCVFTRTVN